MRVLVIDLAYTPNPIERHRLTDAAREEEAKQASMFVLGEYAAREPDALITVYADGVARCGRVPACAF